MSLWFIVVNVVGLLGGIVLFLMGSTSNGGAMPVGGLIQMAAFIWFFFFLLVSLI